MARSLHLKQGNVTFAETDPFRLDLGGELSPVTVRFAIYGEPSAAADNVILLCHALSGSARADQWWPELFAPGAPFANDDFCVVCTNIIGSCYGSTGPLSINPATGAPYGSGFPTVTISDIVRAQARALDLLGISHLRAVIGASIGGMQALEWAIRFPDRVDDVVAIGVAPLGSLGLALNHLQRRALSIAADPREGLRLARAIAMCTYKSPELFDERHGRRPNRRGPAPGNRPTDSSTSPDISTTRVPSSTNASIPTPTPPSPAPWTYGIPNAISAPTPTLALPHAFPSSAFHPTGSSPPPPSTLSPIDFATLASMLPITKSTLITDTTPSSPSPSTSPRSSTNCSTRIRHCVMTPFPIRIHGTITTIPTRRCFFNDSIRIRSCAPSPTLQPAKQAE